MPKGAPVGDGAAPATYPASSVTYNPAASGLTAVQVQAALDELAAGYEAPYIDASSMIQRVTNGAAPSSEELATNDINLDYFDFDKDTEEAVQFKLMCPEDWDLGTIKVKFAWKVATTPGTGTVYWGLRAVAVADDGVLDTAFGTPQVVADAHTADTDLFVSAATPAITVGGTPAKGKLIIFEVYRDADNVSDDYDQDARLLGVQIQFGLKKSNATAW